MSKINTLYKTLVIVLLIFSFGFYGGYQYFVPPLKAEIAKCKTEVAIYKGQLKTIQQALSDEKNKPAKIETVTETKMEIAYVPKETVIYKDKVTGQTVTGTEDTDVQLKVQAPNVIMQYNGKRYEMPSIVGEKNKFEQGKLVGEFSSNATIDVTDLVNSEVRYRLAEQEKDISLGGYLTNKGFVGGIGVVHGNREYKIIGKVPKFKEFYGAGIEFKL